MSWKVICGQQNAIGLQVEIDAHGLKAAINPDLQNEDLNMSWDNMHLPFDQNNNLQTQGIISFRVDEQMLIISAETDENNSEEIAFSEDQLVWFRGKLIAYIKVVLDDNVPEHMDGIIRCGSVISEDENGDEIQDHQELIDNTEYHSAEDLIEDIAGRLGVSPDIVEIIE